MGLWRAELDGRRMPRSNSGLVTRGEKDEMNRTIRNISTVWQCLLNVMASTKYGWIEARQDASQSKSHVCRLGLEIAVGGLVRDKAKVPGTYSWRSTTRAYARGAGYASLLVDLV